MINTKKITVMIALLTCVSYVNAEDKKEGNIFASGVEQLNTYQKLLIISPELVNEYVLLKTDAKTLTKAIKKANALHRNKVKQLSTHQGAVDNTYNYNEKFRLFRQIDNHSQRQQLINTDYELKRARKKLYQTLTSLVAIENTVATNYALKNTVGNREIEEKLLSGERLVLNANQQKIVLDLLIASQNEPNKFVQLLSHPNVVNILPDYLKEQLIVFNDSGIKIEDALLNEGVMTAVIDKIKAIKFSSLVTNEAVGVSIYSQKEAPRILDVVTAPIYLSTALDADAIDPLSAVELYEIPLPSQALVIKLADLRKTGLTE